MATLEINDKGIFANKGDKILLSDSCMSYLQKEDLVELGIFQDVCGYCAYINKEDAILIINHLKQQFGL